MGILKAKFVMSAAPFAPLWSSGAGRAMLLLAAQHSSPVQSMDLKLFAVTFATIFLAELGDKTQLATLSLASGSGSRATVFCASALALVASSALAVLAAEALGRAVPAVWIRRAAGLLFVALGVVFLVRK